jgi:hypothetical protein
MMLMMLWKVRKLGIEKDSKYSCELQLYSTRTDVLSFHLLV